MQEIEPLARVYTEQGAQFLTLPVLWKVRAGEPSLLPMTLVRGPGWMLTLRYGDPQALLDFSADALCQPEHAAAGSDGLILGLIDALIARLADGLEAVGAELTTIARDIFRSTATVKPKSRFEPDLEGAIRRIGQASTVCALTLESVTGIRRALTMLGLVIRGGEHKARLKTLVRDAQALGDHATYLANNASFCLDATLGLISLTQNNIIKIFSVLAAVFLPPTMIASIYGMNFEYMPELSWPFGYPLALVAMLLSAILPYAYFRRRGWL